MTQVPPQSAGTNSVPLTPPGTGASKLGVAPANLSIVTDEQQEAAIHQLLESGKLFTIQPSESPAFHTANRLFGAKTVRIARQVFSHVQFEMPPPCNPD